MPAVQPKRRPITVDLYHKMIETGVLTKGDRVELIEGEMIEMTPMGDDHFCGLTGLEDYLREHLPRALGCLRTQIPIVLMGLDSEPEPDIVVLRPRPGGYSRKPEASDVLLLIEISHTTLVTDRAIKLPLYASAGIPEVWLIDLRNRVIEVYRSPAAGKKPRYAEKSKVRAAESVAPLAFPKLKVKLADIL